MSSEIFTDSGIVDVSELLARFVGTSCDYILDRYVDRETGAPVWGQVALTRNRKGIIATAALTTRVSLSCSRCLEQFNDVLKFTFQEEFLPDIAPFQDEEESFGISPDNLLDLSEAIRQNIVLNLPMKPLCRPDCPGVVSGGEKHGTTT
ncbi:MAG: DUF177 domain-containing protein [Chloroflexota bacterium]